MATALLDNTRPELLDSIEIVRPCFPYTADLLGPLADKVKQSGQLYLSNAHATLSRKIKVTDENGLVREIGIPNERSLTVYLDKKEIITLMTLGQAPELLVLGYLRNQELVSSLDQVKSITVDWEVGAVAVLTHNRVKPSKKHSQQNSSTIHKINEIAELSSAELASDNNNKNNNRRTVTSGCGQGSMFSHLMENIQHLSLPSAKVKQAQIFSVIDAIRESPSVYKLSGSVHACALFLINAQQTESQMQLLVEDVGRHNALDTIAGWMWIQENYAHSLDTKPSYLLYTTGRLTSEMMIKSAQMQVPIVMSRSGTTEMGLQVAEQLGICAIGRAAHRRYLCFTGAERITP